MPSAANAKLEKQASTEAVDNTPIKQCIVVIEHKIRNLEKRKSKLESYREIQKSGKELNSDQKVAVAKYDEVIQTLEFARDLSKQFLTISNLSDKEQKKVARKEALQRTQQDVVKIREVLVIQDTLTQLGSDTARNDFLSGTNGAAQISEADLTILDDLYSEVTPKHDGEGFIVNAQRSADHLNSIIEGKPKDVFGTTYAHIKEIVVTAQGCGYFDLAPEAEAIIEEEVVVEDVMAFQEPAVCEEEVIENQPELVDVPCLEAVTEAPAPTAVPAPAFPPQNPPALISVQQPMPQVLSQGPTVVPVVAPLPHLATVQAVEHAFFAQQQYIQQQHARPIAEVIGAGGNFYFLQESELDSPDVANAGQPNQQRPSLTPPVQVLVPQPIPTQTFTNQTFANVSAPQMFTHPVPVPKVPELPQQQHIPGFVNPTNPPPPIPMPPSLHLPHHPVRASYANPQGKAPPQYSVPQQVQEYQPVQLSSQPLTSPHQEDVPDVQKEDAATAAPVQEESADWAENDATTEWIQPTESGQNEWGTDTQDAWVGQGDGYNTRGGYRGRGRGRGGANGYRARGSSNYHQNGSSRQSSGGGTYYRNNDYQNTNGGGGYNRDNRDSRDNRDARDSRDNRDNREARDSRDNRDSRDSRDNRDARDSRDNRDARDSRDNRDSRDTRDNRDARDSRDNRDSRDTRDNRDNGYQGGYQGGYKPRGSGGRGGPRGGTSDRGAPRQSTRGSGASRPPRGTGGPYVRRENKPQQQQ